MALKEAYPLRLLCGALGVPRRPAQGPPPEEAVLRGRLRELAGAWPRYGYRRLAAVLRGEGFGVGEKRVRSLMRREGLLQAPQAQDHSPGGGAQPSAGA